MCSPAAGRDRRALIGGVRLHEQMGNPAFVRGCHDSLNVRRRASDLLLLVKIQQLRHNVLVDSFMQQFERAPLHFTPFESIGRSADAGFEQIRISVDAQTIERDDALLRQRSADRCGPSDRAVTACIDPGHEVQQVLVFVLAIGQRYRTSRLSSNRSRVHPWSGYERVDRASLFASGTGKSCSRTQSGKGVPANGLAYIRGAVFFSGSARANQASPARSPWRERPDVEAIGNFHYGKSRTAGTLARAQCGCSKDDESAASRWSRRQDYRIAFSGTPAEAPDPNSRAAKVPAGRCSWQFAVRFAL